MNHWRHKSPDDRERILAGESAVIEQRAAGDSPLLIVDTSDLFRVLRAVERGTFGASQVRSSLKTSSGRWTPPDGASDAAPRA